VPLGGAGGRPPGRLPVFFARCSRAASLAA